MLEGRGGLSVFLVTPAALVGSFLLILAGLWLAWPAKCRLSLLARPEHQRMNVDACFLGFRVELGGSRRPRSAQAPGGDDVEAFVRVRLLGFIHFTKRLPRVEMEVRDGTIFLRLWEEWIAGAGTPQRAGRRSRPSGRRETVGGEENERLTRLAVMWRRALLLRVWAGKMWKYLRRFVVLESLCVSLVAGWGSASATAHMVGMIWVAWSALLAGLRHRRVTWRRAPRLRVYPLYHVTRIHLEVLGEARIRQGWAALSALLLAYEAARLALDERRTAGLNPRRPVRQAMEGRA